MFLREDLEAITISGRGIGNGEGGMCGEQRDGGGNKYVRRGANEPLLVSLRNARAPPSSLSDGNGEYFSKDSIFAKYKTTSFTPPSSSMSSTVRPSTAAAGGGRSSLSSPNQYHARGIYGNRDPIGNAQYMHQQREHTMHEDYSPPLSRLVNRPMTANAAVHGTRSTDGSACQRDEIVEAPTFASDFIEDEMERRKLIQRNATLRGLLVKSGAIKGSDGLGSTCKSGDTGLSAPQTHLREREEERKNDECQQVPVCRSSDPAVRILFSGQAASSPQRLREAVRSTRSTRSTINGTSGEDPLANPRDDVSFSSGLASPTPASTSQIRSPSSFTPPPVTSEDRTISTSTSTDWYHNHTSEYDEDINTRGFVSVLCEFNPPVVTIVGSVPDGVVSDLEEAIFSRCVASTAQAAYYAEAYYGSFGGKESRYERYMRGVEDKIAKEREVTCGEKTDGADTHTRTAKGLLSCSSGVLNSRHAARSGPRAQEYHANSAKRPKFVDIAKERRLRVQQLSLPHHYFNDAQQGMLYVVIMDVMEQAGKRSLRRFEEEEMEMEEAKRRGGDCTTRHSGYLTAVEGTPSEGSEQNNTYYTYSPKDQQRRQGAARVRGKPAALPFYYKMVPFDGETSVLHSVVKQIERSHRRALKGPQGRFADSELTTLEPYKHSCELLFIPTELQ